MIIELYLPVAASAKFTADIDVKGKDEEEVFNEFMEKCAPDGSLCYRCNRDLECDFEFIDSEVFGDGVRQWKSYVDKIKSAISDGEEES